MRSFGSAVDIGEGSPRAIVRLWLTPEGAEDLAAMHAQDDKGYDELMQAAKLARARLGEEEPSPSPA